MLVKRIQSNMTGWMRDPQWEKRFSPVQRVRDNDITMICSVISDVLSIYVVEVRASMNSIKLPTPNLLKIGTASTICWKSLSYLETTV